MKRSREILDRLKADGERLPVPESLKPEWIDETIKELEHEEKKSRAGRLRRRETGRGRAGRFQIRALAAAACVCLVAAGALAVFRAGLLFPEQAEEMDAPAENGPEGQEAEGAAGQESAAEQEGGGTETGAGLQDTLAFAEKSYEEIYKILEPHWSGTQIWNTGAQYAEDGAAALPEAAAEESLEAPAADGASKEFGQTNVQTEGVDEADTIKNDGRYLYQLAEYPAGEGEKETGAARWGIQIVDTKGGLREASFVGRFEYPREFYVWEDLLIVLEDGYYTADYVQGADASAAENEEAGAQESSESSSIMVCGDVLYAYNQYTKIHIYDISDRESPRLRKSFTLDGAYRTSRLAEGYFYGFTFFTPKPGSGEEDYEAYIPQAGGSLLPAEKIACPDGQGAEQYLVMVSIDLGRPEELLDSRAMLASDGTFYVSGDSIYLASWHSIYEDGASILYGQPEGSRAEGVTASEAGTAQDYTQLYRFSYEKGRFLAKAEGRIPGRIEGQFSLNQSGEYLQAVTTVTECEKRRVTDDRTGEILGYEYIVPEDDGLSSGLYILDEDLKLTGQIDGLAEGEQIYSARFLGDTAYFVTFRQTDPLFAVDVSDPESPKLLSELKVTGFSEYLHVYGQELLFGLGMEADEDTGEQQGLKLSMFDLTDPAKLSEQARLVLSDYDYSPALYDHRSLLIDTEQNLIGFEVQGWDEGSYQQAYLLYSYEDGQFTQRLDLRLGTDYGSYDSCRGTFIGERFYLLIQDGTVREYSLKTGELLGSV